MKGAMGRGASSLPSRHGQPCAKATSPIEPSEKTHTSVPTNGLERWLRSDLGVVASEGRISRWKDPNGHGRDGIMDRAPRQPALVASARV